MLKVVMTKGLPGSGKSTWAKGVLKEEPGKWKRINKDDLRAMLDDGKWSRGNEEFVLLMRDTMALSALEHGFNVIIDDTNLAPKHEAHLKELAKERKAKFEIKDFTDVSLEECIKRDQKRANYVGEKVIKQMYNQYLKPKPLTVRFDAKLPNAVICDLDGTLALFGDKNPYDRDFENDELNVPVAQVLRYVHQTGLGADIIFVSGRKNKYLEQTKKFLEKHDFSEIIYEALFMPRADDDNRKDVIIKQEIYEANIKGKYNILFVLDDRNQVVDFWRSQGLTVFQVAEGDF